MTYDITIKHHNFNDRAEKALAESLVAYLLFDKVPNATPALWQDVEIFIRYLKRDVWSIDADQRENVSRAMSVYQLRLIVDRLSKAKIIEALNEFFAHDGEIALIKIFENKLHASIDDLIFTQEKRIVTKDDLGDFDKIFKYPAWVEFNDEANDLIFDRILHDKLSDEQIDYFLGAADALKDYDKWFKVAKHVLMTTENAHTFWTAGDILSIIWRAVPKDPKSQKWFKDEIFSIFWPRVQSAWPMLNRDRIDFGEDDSARILGDAIGWLEVLDDIVERLPELGQDYEPVEHDTDKEDFARIEGMLLGKIESDDAEPKELLALLCDLSELVYDENSLEWLKNIAQQKLPPILKRFQSDPDARKRTLSGIDRAVQHAQNYLATLERERNNLAQRLVNA